MQTFRFDPCRLPPEAEALRGEVRAFLDDALKDIPPVVRAQTWSGYDPEFSKKLGAKGWIGMTWPKKYGGHERSALERYVMLEEMLAAGAPVGAHWIGDRQSGQLLLNFGTEEQRQMILPKAAKGELLFCIGMSEPDSGSDLAATRTKAEKIDGGWLVNGTKLWTSNAHNAHYMIALFRTNFDPDKKHSGLTQFLVDLKTPGITIRPIKDLTGNAHFNEVVFEDVFVPDNMMVGEEGNGWTQVTAELAYERSGPERYLSSFLLLTELIRELGRRNDTSADAEIGRLVAHLVTLRQMSVSIAGLLEAGENPIQEASVVKDLGALYEQELPVKAHELAGVEATLGTGSDYAQVLGFLTQASVSFSLRGGTREILRGIIAAVWDFGEERNMSEFRNLLGETIERLLADHATKETVQGAEEGTWPEALWSALEENGLTRLMASEAQGGAGGTWGDALVLLRAQGRYAAPVPLAETMVAAWLLSEAGLDVPDGPLTLLTGVALNEEGTLSGTAEHVPWGRKASLGVALVDGPDGGYQVVSVPLSGVQISEEENIAREPRDTITFDAQAVTSAPCALTEGLETWGALMRSGLMAGGLDYLLNQSVEYANDRKQFGRPIGKFQAVQQQLAVLATQAAAAGAIAAHACESVSHSEDPGFEVAVAKTRIDEAVNLSTSISHQVHGAIGFTYEHGLHLVTRRLWSWRAEYGSGRSWAARLGRQAIERGADALWADVTAR